MFAVRDRRGGLLRLSLCRGVRDAVGTFFVIMCRTFSLSRLSLCSRECSISDEPINTESVLYPPDAMAIPIPNSFKCEERKIKWNE